MDSNFIIGNYRADNGNKERRSFHTVEDAITWCTATNSNKWVASNDEWVIIDITTGQLTKPNHK